MSTAKELCYVFQKVITDPRYKEGLTYGKPRKGHDEGTVEKHIAELCATLDTLRNGFRGKLSLITEVDYWKLTILIHVHDVFKLEGKRRTGHQVSLRHPDSHASLARKFLEEFTQDEDLLAIAQFHDEGHALWQKERNKKIFDWDRLKEALEKIPDPDLYAVFTVIDGYTPGKLVDRSPRWFVEKLGELVKVPRALRALEILGV